MLRLNNNQGFELTYMGAGLRRGGVKISIEDGQQLKKLLSVKIDHHI